jgi:hypothetical protein
MAKVALCHEGIQGSRAPVALQSRPRDLFAEDETERRAISSDAQPKLVEGPSARALFGATVLVRSTANGAIAVRIALTLTKLSLSPRLGLPLAPFRIAGGAARVVRPFRHGSILTVADAISEGSAEGSGP